MIIVKEKTIMCSRGDTFITLFYVKGLVLNENDTAVFTVKDDLGSRQPLLTLPCGIDTLNNIVSVVGSAQEMSVLPEGVFWYDLYLDTANGAHTTLVYPSKLIVRGTVHNDYSLVTASEPAHPDRDPGSGYCHRRADRL